MGIYIRRRRCFSLVDLLQLSEGILWVLKITMSFNIWSKMSKKNNINKYWYTSVLISCRKVELLIPLNEFLCVFIFDSQSIDSWIYMARYQIIVREIAYQHDSCPCPDSGSQYSLWKRVGRLWRRTGSRIPRSTKNCFTMFEWRTCWVHSCSHLCIIQNPAR